jgi:hypothetical protein
MLYKICLKTQFRIGFETESDPGSEINADSCEFNSCSGVAIKEKVKFLTCFLSLFSHFYLLNQQSEVKFILSWFLAFLGRYKEI